MRARHRHIPALAHRLVAAAGIPRWVTEARLPAGLEVSALMRRAQAQGDFATVLRKGDADRGAILLVIASRGQTAAILERQLSPAGDYRWARVEPDSLSSGDIQRFVDKRVRFDEDLWVIELDVAATERFIAETIGEG